MHTFWLTHKPFPHTCMLTHKECILARWDTKTGALTHTHTHKLSWHKHKNAVKCSTWRWTPIAWLEYFVETYFIFVRFAYAHLCSMTQCLNHNIWAMPGPVCSWLVKKCTQSLESSPMGVHNKVGHCCSLLCNHMPVIFKLLRWLRLGKKVQFWLLCLIKEHIG